MVGVTQGNCEGRREKEREATSSEIGKEKEHLIMDLVHKVPLIFTNPNTSILLSVFSSHVQVQDPRRPKEKPKEVPFKPLAENPNFGISDEKVSPKVNLDIFPRNVEHEGFPNAKTSEEHTSYDLPSNKTIFYTPRNLNYCDMASSGQSGGVLNFLSEEVYESSFCDTLGVVRLPKDQDLVVYAIVESMSFRLGEAYGGKECCIDLCLRPRFPFDRGAKCGYDDAGTPNFLLSLHNKQSIILENLRANMSLSVTPRIQAHISNLKRREVHLGLVLKVDSQGQKPIMGRSLFMCLWVVSQGHKPIMGRSQLICTGGSLMVTVQYSNDYKDDNNEALHTQYIFCTDVPHGGPVFHAAGTDVSSLDDTFTLDSFLHYLFSYDDIHTSFGFVSCRGRTFVCWSTWSYNAIWLLLTFVVALPLDACLSRFLCDSCCRFFMIITKDSWLYFKRVPPWSVSLSLCVENHDINLFHSDLVYGIVMCKVLDYCELDPLVNGMINLALCPWLL
ncbi:hypothetical protein FXO37_30555 [Capsicum annuum]|nr:hypothetical protein FXO37_30555 [Capsicum annuum]